MGELSQFYADIKSGLTPAPVATNLVNVSNPVVGAEWRRKAVCHADALRDNCRKHILADIYCKILPLDDDFKDGHCGMIDDDIACMLAKKGCTATQYLKSCFESTKAPFVEYLIRATDMIGRTYMEAEEAILKDAKANNKEIANPEPPSIEDEENMSALVDITKDTEYQTFIDRLKDKTIKKIVKDVSDIIEDKKDNSQMTYNSESAVKVCLEYLQKQLWDESAENKVDIEAMLGLAIREATLREIDAAFDTASRFNEFATEIRFGKGALINEAAVNKLKSPNE